MPLHQLVRKGYLEGPVKNITDDKDITNGKSVRITYNKGFKYELVDNGECKVYYCKSDFCDSDGNGHTEVDYVEATGEQYIDTEYVFKNKPKVMGDIMITSSSDLDIMGTSSAIPGCFIIDFRLDNSMLYYRYSSSSSTSIYTGIIGKKWYNFEFSDKFIVDGVEKGTIASYDFSSNTQSFLIGRGRSYGHARFKEIKMYDGDELVRDLVPYYKKYINKGGMLDKVHNVFYENQGAGEFLWG